VAQFARLLERRRRQAMRNCSLFQSDLHKLAGSSDSSTQQEAQRGLCLTGPRKCAGRCPPCCGKVEKIGIASVAGSADLAWHALHARDLDREDTPLAYCQAVPSMARNQSAYGQQTARAAIASRLPDIRDPAGQRRSCWTSCAGIGSRTPAARRTNGLPTPPRGGAAIPSAARHSMPVDSSRPIRAIPT